NLLGHGSLRPRFKERQTTSRNERVEIFAPDSPARNRFGWRLGSVGENEPCQFSFFPVHSALSWRQGRSAASAQVRQPIGRFPVSMLVLALRTKHGGRGCLH